MDRISYDNALEIGLAGRPKHPRRSKTYYRSEEPFLCLVCNKAWQYTENRVYVEYVADFPTLGCTRKKCRNCSEDKQEEK